MLNRLIFLILLSVSTVSFALNCNGPLETQSDMNICSYQDYINVDKKLNKIYARILKKYKNYPAALQNTIRAEKAWIKFRDAQLEMKYPSLKKGCFYGSIHPVIENWYLEKLTNQRIKQLEEILNDKYVDELNA